MKDRISKYPGRVKLIPVGGAENTYTVTRADEPTEEGTPLNKATLLSDLTAAEIGLTDDVPTVNGALYKLITLINAIANNYTKIRFAAAVQAATAPLHRQEQAEAVLMAEAAVERVSAELTTTQKPGTAVTAVHTAAEEEGDIQTPDKISPQTAEAAGTELLSAEPAILHTAQGAAAVIPRTAARDAMEETAALERTPTLSR